MPTDKLREFVKQERQAQISLENLEDFLVDYQDERDRGVVELRLSRLDEIYEKFCDVRVKIELLTDDVELVTKPDEEEDEAEWAEHVAAEEKARQKKNTKIFKDFENKFFRLKQELLSKCNTPAGIVAELNPRAADGFQPSRTRYPELSLPTFTGKLLEWINFRDNFTSLIHNNEHLNPIDKFNYLRSSLRDDALLQINQIQVSATNYGLAWNVLEAKYENHKLIAHEHMKALFAVVPLRSESFQGLNNLLNTFRINLQQLDKLGEKTEDWSTLLAFMLSQKLDDDTLRAWEIHHSSSKIPTYTAMAEFLDKHCAVLQSTATRRSSDVRRPYKPPAIHTTVSTDSMCVVCNSGQHAVEHCRRFGKMRIIDRRVLVRRLGLCFNCLYSGHFVADCSRDSCSKCGQRHHVLLHPYVSNSGGQANSSYPSQTQRNTERPQAANGQSVPRQSNFQNQSRMSNSQTNPQSTPISRSSTQGQSQPPPTTIPPAIHHTATLPDTHLPTHTAILSTAIVQLVDRDGNTFHARALLDNGSQICMMTENLAQRLNFKRFRENLPVKGVGGSVTVAKQSVLAKVISRYSSFSTPELKFFVVPRITLNLPQQNIDISSWNLPADLRLADPSFYETNTVDIILGVSIFYELLLNEQTRLPNGGPTLRNTELGWIVAGDLADDAITYSAIVAVSTEEVFEQLAKFWELESCRTKSCLSVEESRCEAIFDETTTRDADGKFRVTLPKREFMLDRLGESRSIATKRFLSLERRMDANPEMKALYTAFIHEYKLMGHMREITDDEREPTSVYYMPHHSVMKPDSTTTKLRVVFDASCATATGVSLNDALMVGPVVQDDLLSILIRFRIHKFAIVGDVEKMYRMVNVHQSDQPLQRIPWRESSEDPIRSFQLTTVTYGTSCAPYLATRCLRKCAEEGKDTHPAAAEVIEDNFYVDDMLAGAHTVKEGAKLCKDVANLLGSAGFNLRKWHSNHRDILKGIPPHLRDSREFLDLDTSATVKTLGLTWEPLTDKLWFKVPHWTSKTPVTHRTVLSDSARLFDPYGLVGPVVVQAKLYLQELWKEKYVWDEPLSEELQLRWLEFRDNLNGLDALSVPRWLAFDNDVIACEIHGFCDASEKAYGAAIYMRCISKDGRITVRLLMAKSKVAPLEDLSKRKKKQTIPRLELSSALLLAHLYETVSNSMKIKAQAFFWTDSMIVMFWLLSHPSRWQIFVANRVSEIQHITRCGIWNHVPGVENPADVISRGVTPAQLVESSLWWNGPDWLCEDSGCWPKNAHIAEQQFDSVLLEEKPLVTAAVQTLPPSAIFTLRSSLLNLVRLTAWLLRFAYNSSPGNRAVRRTGCLTFKEHQDALLLLVKQAQSECFSVDISDVVAKQQVRPSSRLHMLNPVLIDGLLCVGGRLRNASVSRGRKNPMILDCHHPLSKLIMIDYHHRLLHGGPQLMISCVRERFWPIGARDLARKVVHKCMSCFRVKPTVHEQIMGDLPKERVSPAPAFLRVGIDYCGPFDVRNTSNRKGAPATKCYLCIFVCLVVKAVHIEVVADLTAEAFLAALRRFVARRGKPEVIFCDNGTNFVGAHRELEVLRRLFRSEQFQETVSAEAAKDGIEFKFIPPRSPNFGGLWEAAVKSAKSHLKRVIGTNVLKSDELQTLVVQVEACLNSRPITPISNDPRDLEPLTPGHFLIQRPLTAIPEPSLSEIPANRLGRWQQVQSFFQLIWKRWSSEYLSTLQGRNKWTRKKDNLHIGTMVLLKDDNIPPLKWKLGRVTEIHPGPDGNVRVVTVRAQGGPFRRAISKICILPILDNEQPQIEESQ